MNLIESSKPFARTRDDAPARWLLDILWLVLAAGEDTNGEYSVIEQFMPVGSGCAVTSVPWLVSWDEKGNFAHEQPFFSLVNSQDLANNIVSMAMSKD